MLTYERFPQILKMIRNWMEKAYQECGCLLSSGIQCTQQQQTCPILPQQRCLWHLLLVFSIFQLKQRDQAEVSYLFNMLFYCRKQITRHTSLLSYFLHVFWFILFFLFHCSHYLGDHRFCFWLLGRFRRLQFLEGNYPRYQQFDNNENQVFRLEQLSKHQSYLRKIHDAEKCLLMQQNFQCRELHRNLLFCVVVGGGKLWTFLVGLKNRKHTPESQFVRFIPMKVVPWNPNNKDQSPLGIPLSEACPAFHLLGCSQGWWEVHPWLLQKNASCQKFCPTHCVFFFLGSKSTLNERAVNFFNPVAHFLWPFFLTINRNKS